MSRRSPRPTGRCALLVLALAGPASVVAGDALRFEDATERAGLHFVHETGASGQKYLVETMGSGVCFVDYDRDGDEDLYVVQSAPLKGFETDRPLTNILYRNEGPDGRGHPTFVDRTEAAGVGDPSYGMGCTAADLDLDAFPEILVTNLGPDVLYRNRGDGTFVDVTDTAGVGDPRWSASAAFGDADGDGHLDLFVVHYVDFTVLTHRPCRSLMEGMSSYCHPSAYAAEPDSFYRNRGDGTFRDATPDLGKVEAGNGLGVIWSDLDNDGRPDIFVANDATPNHLYHNEGRGRFREVALLRGVAVNEDGNSESGMGVEAIDLDGDGWRELFLTHLDMQTNTLYRNLGGGRFVDWSFPSGVGQPSLLHVGFGTAALDFDLDGDPDLMVTNGHVMDDAEMVWSTVTYAQRSHMLENDGTGRFREMGRELGEVFQERLVGRGLAVADVEGDGDLDVAVTASRGRLRLLRALGARGGWLEIDLRQAGGNLRAVGAEVTVRTDRRQVREVRTASSYMSQNAMTLHFGLGSQDRADVEVRWPGGERTGYAGIPARHRYRIPRPGLPGLAGTGTSDEEGGSS